MTRRDEILQRIRQNHALEHATIHLLARRIRGIRLVGRSDWNGFTIYGNVETPDVVDAVADGLARLRAHESWLAIHPRCGTNLATGILAATVIGQVVTSGIRSPLLRLLGAGAAVAAGLALAQPLGRAVQEHVTTSADMDGTYVRVVECEERGGVLRHRVQVGHLAES